MRKASREPNEQREQSQTRLSLAKRRMRKASRHMDAFDDAISRSLERTAVVRITLTEPPIGKQHDTHTIDHAAQIGLGSKKYTCKY